MCATADIAVMLLSRELHKSGKASLATRPVALRALIYMAKNGFPGAQLALAGYLRERGIEQGNAEKVKESIKCGKAALRNFYTTPNEKKYIKQHRLTKPLTREEERLLAVMQGQRANAKRQEKLKAIKRKEEELNPKLKATPRAQTHSNQKTI